MITYPQLYALFAAVIAGLLLMAIIAANPRPVQKLERGNPAGCAIEEGLGCLTVAGIFAILWWLAGYPF